MLCLVASLWQQVPGWRGTRSHSGKFLSSQPVSLDFSSGRDARSDWSGPGLPCCLGWRVLPGPSSRWFRSARSRRSRTTNKWGRTIGLVWAWATLLLGVESLAWPIITMVQISSITTEPNDEQMGTILSAVLMGLISAVFWITFSYGLFKRTGQPITDSSTEVTDSPPPIVRSGRSRENK